MRSTPAPRLSNWASCAARRSRADMAVVSRAARWDSSAGRVVTLCGAVPAEDAMELGIQQRCSNATKLTFESVEQ